MSKNLKRRFTANRRRAIALVAGLTGSGIGAVGTAVAQNCPEGTTSYAGQCYTCPTGYIFSNGTCTFWDAKRRPPPPALAPSCPPGTYNSDRYRKCVSTPLCPSGTAFSTAFEQCVGTGSDRRGGGCFLTTACVEHLGLADDCFELKVLRGLRDERMAKDTEGAKMIEVYYAIAPLVLERLPDDRRGAILDAIYARYILPSVFLCKVGLPGMARKFYAVGTMKLIKTYAPDFLEAYREELIGLFGKRAEKALV